MGAPKGHKRYGGRVAGTPNKASLSAVTVSEMCKEKGISPAEVLIGFCNDPDKVMRFQASKELMKYIYPQKREETKGLDSYTLEEILAHIEKKMRTIKDVSGPVIESGSSAESGETIPQQDKVQP